MAIFVTSNAIYLDHWSSNYWVWDGPISYEDMLAYEAGKISIGDMHVIVNISDQNGSSWGIPMTYAEYFTLGRDKPAEVEQNEQEGAEEHFSLTGPDEYGLNGLIKITRASGANSQELKNLKLGNVIYNLPNNIGVKEVSKLPAEADTNKLYALVSKETSEPVIKLYL
jgi:hypothetical protein